MSEPTVALSSVSYTHLDVYKRQISLTPDPPMRILLVKTSSLGDVIHNLPVLSDLRCSVPGAQIDWCVEEAFADIPRLHPGVDQVIPVAIRRWRRNLGQLATWRELRDFRKRIGATTYDVVLDTQGLLKSALIARQARGRRCGYAAEAAREPLAARFYDTTFVIPRNVHAVERNRWLAAAAFDYPVDLPLDYGLSAPAINLDLSLIHISMCIRDSSSNKRQGATPGREQPTATAYPPPAVLPLQ